MLIQILILLIWVLVPSAGNAQAYTELNKILSSVPGSSRISISVFDADRKQSVFTHNADLPLRPASNIKIASTSAALLYFGPGHKIATSLYFDKGKLNNGTLNGDLYFKGSGNPAFTINELNTLAVMIKEKGIKRIAGKIIYDNSLFIIKKSRKSFLYSPSPIDLPTVSPISVNHNILSAYADEKGRITLSIESRYIQVIQSGANTPRIKETENGIKMFINPALFKVNKNKIHFFIKNPPLFASLLLKEKLEKNGITAGGICVPGKVPPGLQEVSTCKDLTEIIKEINGSSYNFYAETIFEILEKALSAKGEKTNNADPVLNFLQSTHIDTKGIIVADGSGISSKNRISSSALIELLRQMNDSPTYSNPFKNSLSVAGVSGTLKDRFLNSEIKGMFRGKSGFMAGTSSLSGYLQTKSGRNFIVSMIFNFNEKDIGYYQETEKKILEMIYSIN